MATGSFGAITDSSSCGSEWSTVVVDKRRRVEPVTDWNYVPATVAATTSSATVPPSTTQFSGRHSEVEILHTLLNQNTNANIATPATNCVSPSSLPSLSPSLLIGVVVSGFGGIGKTELAKFYAWSYYNHYDGNVVWIHAENVIAMRNSFLKLLLREQTQQYAHETLDDEAAAVEMDISNHDLAQKCYAYVQQRSRNALFIFDNAEGHGAVKEFLPVIRTNGNGGGGLIHLFTSRTGAPEDWNPAQFANLPLGVLTLQDSINFLRKALSPKAAHGEHNAEYRNLAEELGCYPLALTQAAAYIAKENTKHYSLPYAISGFMHAFKMNDSAMELLDYKFWESAKGANNKSNHGQLNGHGQEVKKPSYEKTLYTVLELSLAKIRGSTSEGGPDAVVGQFAIEILHRLAFCGADKVPLKLFLDNWPPSFEYGMGDQECVLRAVDLLRRYSMITLDPDEQYISIHRLFQRIVRLYAHARGQELKYISSLRQMMSPYIIQEQTNSKDSKDGGSAVPSAVDPDQRLFIAHALQLCKYTFEYQDSLIQFLHQNKNISTFVQGLTDFHAGEWTLLCQHEFYQEALDLAISTVAMYDKGPPPLLGPGSEAALSMRLKTGRTYTKQHFCFKTEFEYRVAYELALQHLGPDHELTLDLMCHLAWILSQPCLNDRAQARKLYQQCYERARTVLPQGPLHRITVLAKAGIGFVESLDDHHEEALAEYEDVILFEPMVDDILDDESFRIVFTNLQKVYTALGRHEDAYRASDRIVQRLQTKYGPTAIPTLIAKVNLVERLLDLKNYDGTRELLKAIFTEAQRKLGENRLAFLELREHAATLERETGPDAVQEWVHQVYEDVLTRKKTTLAFNEERHESVIWTEFKVCQLHFRRNEFDKAMEVGRRVQEKLARLWGEGHGNTCKVKSFLWSMEQYRLQVTTGVWISDYVCTEVDCKEQNPHSSHPPRPPSQAAHPRPNSRPAAGSTPTPPVPVPVTMPMLSPLTPSTYMGPASCASSSGVSVGSEGIMSPEMEPLEGNSDAGAADGDDDADAYAYACSHAQGQFDPERLTCSIPPCNGRAFSLKNVFVRHMGNIHHVNLYRDKRKERVFTCQYCGKVCGRADNLRSHIKKKHAEKRESVPDTNSV